MPRKRPSGGKPRKRSKIDELRLIRAWTDWNTRSRSEYLEAILRLPPEQRTKDRGASWGSIQDIFLHVLEDYLWWYEAVPRGQSQSEDLVGRKVTDESFRALNHRVDSLVRSLIDPLKQSDLGRMYVVSGTVDGKPYRMKLSLADIIWHMLEEELQHRGELNALFWQMGINPPTRAWFSSELSLAEVA